MTQDEAWKKNYDEVMSFITENGRNLSKYNLEERRLYTWLKHQRKVMNAGNTSTSLATKTITITKINRFFFATSGKKCKFA